MSTLPKLQVGDRVRKRAKVGTIVAMEPMGSVFPETYRVKWDNGREDAGWRPDALEAASSPEGGTPA